MEKLCHAIARYPFRGNETLYDQGLAHRLRNGHARIECPIRILKDDLRPPPKAPKLRMIEAQQIDTVKLHITCGRLDEPQDCSPDGRLSRSRFTGEAENLPAVDRERHTLHRMYVTHELAEHAASNLEALAQIAHIKESWGDRHGSFSQPMSRQRAQRTSWSDAHSSSSGMWLSQMPLT